MQPRARTAQTALKCRESCKMKSVLSCHKLPGLWDAGVCHSPVQCHVCPAHAPCSASCPRHQMLRVALLSVSPQFTARRLRRCFKSCLHESQLANQCCAHSQAACTRKNCRLTTLRVGYGRKAFAILACHDPWTVSTQSSTKLSLIHQQDLQIASNSYIIISCYIWSATRALSASTSLDQSQFGAGGRLDTSI